MTASTYITDCPSCGGQLAPHAGDPASAPWLCANCSLGFWVCELTPDARQSYRGADHDWDDYNPTIAALVATEAEQAAKRGCSALPEQLSTFSLADLQQIQRLILSPGFASEVAAAITAAQHHGGHP